ncbi:MAG: efflux RND transporter periplasmic adaptor subunit, partial [Bacteroidetes bacterium]|nr:efflux RND transporter periplasmic adaptor subunit [Bacteroidota bacterium]
IVISESAAKLAEIQTLKIVEGTPEKSVYLQGKIHADERNIAELTARFDGRIEKLFINFTGQNVKKGEKLATVYSPKLVTAQRELLEAISYKEIRPSLYKAARGKLKLWDLTEKQINDIELKGDPQLYFDVLSPITGTVSMRHVAIGDYIKEGKPLFQVIDLSKLWVMFDAYESDLSWIKMGDRIDFTVQSLPGENFSAKVTYIDPFINAKTRTTQVRVEVSNTRSLLKPQMFTSGLLKSKIAMSSNQILIPKSSILWTGKRAIVYVKVANRDTPSFKYREIVLGPEAGAFYIVAEGLQAGEEIAVNGVFKIDAASQLQGLPSMMNPEGGAGSTPHDMSKMNMGNEGKTNVSTINKMEMSAKKMKAPVAFKKQLGELVVAYIDLKDAFVATNEELSESAAQTTLNSLNKVDMSLLNQEAHNFWMTELKQIRDNIKGIISMKGIEIKRSHFEIVSNHLTIAIKSFGFVMKNKNTLYRQFCPMTFDNKGAYWLSDVEEIRNPYFGDMMLKCGETKETIISTNK